MMMLPDSYLDDLHTGPCHVIFTKNDGTTRHLLCTLDPAYLPKQVEVEEQIQQRAPNHAVVAVWDLENEGWRSFRKDSVTSFSLA